MENFPEVADTVRLPLKIQMDPWRIVEKIVVKDGEQNRTLVLMEKQVYTAFHDTVDNHLFSMVTEAIK